MTSTSEKTTGLRDAAQQAYTEATEHAARAAAAKTRAHVLDATARILDADLPAGAAIDLITWPEENNGDDTFDVDLGTVYDQDGNEIGDLSGTGALPAGHYGDDTPDHTDFDIWITRDDGRISVDKVHTWAGIGAAPLLFSVQPEAWDGDYAIQAGPAVEFDYGPVVAAMDPEERREFLDSLRADRFDHDAIYFTAVDHGLAPAGFGPFTVYAPDIEDLNAYESDE